MTASDHLMGGDSSPRPSTVTGSLIDSDAATSPEPDGGSLIPEWMKRDWEERGLVPPPEPFGWHADGDLCLGPECGNIDEATGNHGTDVHSDEWWEGFTEGARRALASVERDAHP